MLSLSIVQSICGARSGSPQINVYETAYRGLSVHVGEDY